MSALFESFVSASPDMNELQMHHECMLYRMHSCLCKRTRVAGRGLASRRMIYGTARAAAVSLMISACLRLCFNA